MSYDRNFFEKYKSYLEEKQVRKVHNEMFHFFKTVFPRRKVPFNIIDFGCGQCCEFRDYGQADRWFGFDLEPPPRTYGVHACDYTKITAEEIKKVVWFSGGFGFVSLFSTECCMDWPDKYQFYRRMFQELPIHAALVSGFYYANRVKELKVEEAGGIVSYQTTENAEDFMCDEFIEWRTHRRVPSQMFGDDVVEVWKVLTRNVD